MSLSSTAAAASGRTPCARRHAGFGGCRIYPRSRRSARWPAQRAGTARRPRRARRFLSQLKEVMHAVQRSAAARYCMEQYQAFLHNDHQILFVHIREPEQIERFRQAAGAKQCRTVLVRRPAMESTQAARSATARMITWRPMSYDGVFVNDGPLEELPGKVQRFLNDLIKQRLEGSPHGSAHAGNTQEDTEQSQDREKKGNSHP